MVSAKQLFCWRCGQCLDDEPMPLGRLAECRACGAQLHVCRMCTFFVPGRQFGCREEHAEDVNKKESANFCDWFKPNPAAHRPPDSARSNAARSSLEQLFGAPGGEDGADGAKPAALDDLFGPPRK